MAPQWWRRTSEIGWRRLIHASRSRKRSVNTPEGVESRRTIVPNWEANLNVTIALITLRRPEELRQLLYSLAAQRLGDSAEIALSVIVVDNDPREGACEVVASVQREVPLAIAYVREPRVGIPIARNTALRHVPPGCDLFGFLDDDELAPADWLARMVSGLERSGADIVWGPVRSVYPPDAPRLLVRSGLFDKEKLQAHLADLAEVPVAATDNVLMRWAPVADRGLRFEEAMRFTGGEDLKFFTEAVRHGLRIRWVRDAYVLEKIHRRRLSWRWLVKRQYRIGNNFFDVNLAGVPKMKQLVYLGVGAAAIISGVWIMLTSIEVARRFVGFGRIFNGAGMIGAALGLRFEEYRPHRIVSGEGQIPFGPALDMSAAR